MRLIKALCAFRAFRRSIGRPAPRAPGLALSATWPGDRKGGPRLVRRHYFHPGVPRLPLPGGDHGLGKPPRASLAAVEHAGYGLLYGRAGGGPDVLRRAGEHQHQPGQPVPSRRSPARPGSKTEPGSSTERPHHAAQRVHVERPARAHPVTARQRDLDPTVR